MLLLLVASENSKNSLPDVLEILILGLYGFLRAGPEKDTERIVVMC